MAEVTNWRAVKVPHDYHDGTTHTWEVHGDSYDGSGNKLNILLGSWLTEDTARLIAAAPDMYAALRNSLAVAALAKAEHRDPSESLPSSENVPDVAGEGR